MVFYKWVLDRGAARPFEHSDYGMVVYSWNLVAVRTDLYVPHSTFCHSLAQSLVTQTSSIVSQIETTMPLQLLSDMSVEKGAWWNSAQNTTNIPTVLLELQRLEGYATDARSTLMAFFDGFCFDDTCSDADWNVTAAFMGRLDFEASYNAVTSTLRKGEKEWRAFWVDMLSYNCTNIHREALEKRIWKLLDVFDDLLVALDRYWFPAPIDEVRFNTWGGQSLADDARPCVLDNNPWGVDLDQPHLKRP